MSERVVAVSMPAVEPLIDNRTRLRLILVVWVMSMIAMFRLQNYIMVFVAGLIFLGVISAMVYSRWRSYLKYQAALVAKTDQDAKLAARADQQHVQFLQGNDRGIYGDGYLVHKLYEDLVNVTAEDKFICGDRRPIGGRWYTCSKEFGHDLGHTGPSDETSDRRASW